MRRETEPDMRGDGANLARMHERIAQLQQLHGGLHQARRFIEAGEDGEAEKLLKRIVSAEPDYFGAWFLLGKIYYTRSDWWSSVAAFNRASMLNSADTATLINLSLAHTKLGALELAEQTLKLARERTPKNTKIYRALAEVYQSDRDYQKAIEYLYKAHQIEPRDAAIVLDLGINHLELGNTEEAQDWLLKALKIAKKKKSSRRILPFILVALSILPVGPADIDLLAEIETAFPGGKVQGDEGTTIKMAFARGRALASTDRHAEAWEQICEANEQIWREVKDSAQGHFRRLRETYLYAKSFNAGEISALRLSQKNPNPIFIVGASRAGKTTLEDSLKALGDVKLGYESKVVERALARTSLEVGLPKLKDFWSLPDNVDDKFSEVFEEELAARAEGARLFTVTYPGSIHHAGRLARIHRNALFVFVKRDLWDQTLRCFQKHYAKSNLYSYDLETCAEFIKSYNAIVDVWQEKLGERCQVVSYEEFVANPKKIVTDIADRVKVELPEELDFEIGDDRGCAEPYREFMQKALQS